MFFSWFAADFCTDAAFADKSPEERANPSMEAWNNPGYLAQQRKRLPTHKYRRLHLNLPGAPSGAAFSADHVMAAIVPGRKRLPREEGVKYFSFVDMSGGSSDLRFLGSAISTLPKDRRARLPRVPNRRATFFAKSSREKICRNPSPRLSTFCSHR